MLKKKIKDFLHKKELYYPLKYSRPFRIYQLLFKPQEIKQERREVSFYKSFLPPCKLIFDIGANDGHKTEAFLKISDQIISCDPDRGNFNILQIRFRNKKSRVMIEKKALSDKKGVAVLHTHHTGSAFNTLSDKWMEILEVGGTGRWNEVIKFKEEQEVETTTLDILINKYGFPDFIKIDVEGFEESVLKGLSHPVACLSFETLLPEYSTELKNCLQTVESLNRSAKYNIALHEKLVLSSFVSKPELEQWIYANTNAGSFEVIVKMAV